MGLDITAYRQIVKGVGDEGKHPKYDDDVDYENGWFTLYVHHDFAERSPDVSEGRYRAAEKVGFRAGSYGGYNLWRDQLAELVGFPAVEHPAQHRKGEMSHAAAAWHGSATPDASTRPFFELINFSDCEGTIGTAVCKKLAADFAAHQARADAHPDEWFRAKYADWRKAFEMAADGGAVCFH